eukprot:XP_019081025.1 PREDICTED: TMV resistance protein N-like isoform X1 [Vitis vinifera]
MASSSTQKPSSSSAPTPKCNFDVFLSFRGEDTRYNFTDHLFVNLDWMGIGTFRDDKLERGEEIAQELLGTIEGSRFSIIVFSEKYAHSKWCLDEFAKIMECRKEMDQIVLPVFYHVEPSDVRKKTESFEDAFAVHEKNVDKETVQRWRAAMTEAGNLGGWHVKDGEQLESLVGSRNWFGAGTTIIITTRDQQLLRYYGADVTYEVKKLDDAEAIQLFNKHAFEQNSPNKDYVTLSNCMAAYA